VSVLRYVYGILAADDAAVVRDARLSGIEGAGVRVIVGDHLAAAVSDLDATAYGADTLNTRIADLEWLSSRAEAHQAVNARLLELAGSVIPLSFGALYRDDERVREMLHEDEPSRVARIEALRGPGVAIALDDVGADRRSLALMPFVQPEVIKLDLRLVQTPGRAAIAAIVHAAGTAIVWRTRMPSTSSSANRRPTA